MDFIFTGPEDLVEKIDKIHETLKTETRLDCLHQLIFDSKQHFTHDPRNSFVVAIRPKLFSDFIVFHHMTKEQV